ncbi:MAG: glycosyltransferase family 39 protein [Alphaproteobacteria bacterium]|nr:glycosyltransferase family 39 protein [Alphaproteobacteria bacterium]
MSKHESIKYKIPSILLLLHLLIAFIYCLYLSWKTDTLGGDTLEHIHSSWLVYANFIPYKDFFQHHNPLLWYLFSPIAGLHAHGINDNTITSIAITSAIVASFINYLYLYLITSRFLSTKSSGIVAAAIALTPYMLLSVIHFRPDNFMLLTFFAGFYYYLCYIQDKKLWQLSLSFLLFWCSFMFLQKIIFTLILLGIITLYLLCTKKMKLVDVLYACSLPFVLSLGYVLYLISNDILAVWYHSNFTFNLYIPELFDERRIGIIWPELALLLCGATLAVLFCFKKSNIYFKIIAIIWFVELLQRVFYFSAFAYYFCLLVYMSSILTAVFLTEKVFKHWWVLQYVLVGALYFCMYHPAIYNGNIGTRVTRFYKPLNKEVIEKSTPCDYILNGDGTIYNLYNRDPHYYWNLLGQTDVIGAKVGIHPLMDINKIIEVYKPKIITAAPYYDKYAKEHGYDVVVHQPDMELVNRYYKPMSANSNLYILKPEFAPAKCEFDYKKKHYQMYD